MDRNEMIKRARELAALAEGATPGPWVQEWMTQDEDGQLQEPELTGYVVDTSPFMNEVANCRDMGDTALVAAAPEMAALLEKMADELER